MGGRGAVRSAVSAWPGRLVAPVVAPVVAGLGLIVIAVVARSTPSHPIRNPPATKHSTPPSSPPPQPNPTRAAQHHHAAGSSLNWPVTIGVALLVLAILWAFGRRRRHRWGGRVRVVRPRRTIGLSGVVVAPEPERLDSAVTAALGELERSSTNNEAIIACWRRLVATLGEHGVHTTASETSTQLVLRTLAERGVPPEPLRELAALFRAARFSGRTLGETERDAARTSLRRIQDALAVPRDA